MKVRELLTDESKWIKACLAKDKNGNRVGPLLFPDAVSFCIAGALVHCYYDGISDSLGNPYWEGYNKDKINGVFYKVEVAVQELGFDNMVDWNNHQDRTFADVKALVEKLDV